MIDDVCEIDREADLHGFTAVAELKRGTAVVVVVTEDDLHGFTAVAELKRRRRPEVVEGDRGISTASPPWPN